MTARVRLGALAAVTAVAFPTAANATTGGAAAPSGGSAHPSKARLTKDGLAVAPRYAPTPVKRIIAAGNKIAKTPYRYGGGHASFKDSGYDCSGSVSYALRGARLVKRAMTSGEYMSWGSRGKGDWVTVYAHGGHVYMTVAGLRFDTSGARANGGSRWHKTKRGWGDGYAIRHPKGL